MPKKVAKKAVKKTVKAATKKTVGAGRPKGSGKFGCETKAMRIPTHLADDVQTFVMKKLKAEGKK